MYDHSSRGNRPGFRHELASALALVELAWRVRPSHPALQGGREEILDRTVGRDTADEARITAPRGLLADLVELDETTFNLVVYLVMCHHGKVRATLPMSARDQDNPDAGGGLPVRGVRDGDVLPALVLADSEQRRDFELPEVTLRLDMARLGLSKRYGPSWVERVLGLRDQLGNFLLAWLEALLRVADVRASQIATPWDPRLPRDLVEVAALPDVPDPDAELRTWIEETLTTAGTQSVIVRSKGMPKTPRTSTRSNRRGGP
jgi:CRISPR-associated endonuclease/helicase Cas3